MKLNKSGLEKSSFLKLVTSEWKKIQKGRSPMKVSNYLHGAALVSKRVCLDFLVDVSI